MIQTLKDTAGLLNYAKTSNKNNSYAYLYTYLFKAHGGGNIQRYEGGVNLLCKRLVRKITHIYLYTYKKSYCKYQEI